MTGVWTCVIFYEKKISVGWKFYRTRSIRRKAIRETCVIRQSKGCRPLPETPRNITPVYGTEGFQGALNWAISNFMLRETPVGFFFKFSRRGFWNLFLEYKRDMFLRLFFHLFTTFDKIKVVKGGVYYDQNLPTCKNYIRTQNLFFRNLIKSNRYQIVFTIF